MNPEPKCFFAYFLNLNCNIISSPYSNVPKPPRNTSLKASRMLNEIGVYEILNRPRSPEEIFHMLNFNTLEEEFFRIFDLLHFQELLTKQEVMKEFGNKKASLNRILSGRNLYSYTIGNKELFRRSELKV